MTLRELLEADDIVIYGSREGGCLTDLKAFGFSLKPSPWRLGITPPPRIHLLDYTHVSSSIRLNLFSSFLRSATAFHHLKLIFFPPITICALVFWHRSNCVPFRHACNKRLIWFSQNKKRSNTGKNRKFHTLRCYFYEIIHHKT